MKRIAAPATRAWVLALLLMAGCAGVVPPPATTMSVAPAAWFELSGRISVRVDDKLDFGKLVWLREPAQERMQFFSPFGTEIAELTRDAAGAATLRRGQDVWHAPSIGELAERALGVAVEPGEVARWVQADGFIEGSARAITLANGSVWEVTADGVTEGIDAQGRAWRRAGRVTAVHGSTVLKLVVDGWEAR